MFFRTRLTLILLVIVLTALVVYKYGESLNQNYTKGYLLVLIPSLLLLILIFLPSPRCPKCKSKSVVRVADWADGYCPQLDGLGCVGKERYYKRCCDCGHTWGYHGPGGEEKKGTLFISL